MEICTCHFNEDLDWLKNSEWPVRIVHKEGGAPLNKVPDYTVPNVGLEATAYLHFIIERYETLPEQVAFIHGHETSYHQLGDRPLLEMIRTANIKKYGYVPLNNSWRCVNTVIQIPKFLEFYRELGLINFPDRFITCCGAQFIVSRERILGHSKKFYQKLYSSIKTRDQAIAFELVWHVLFGENITIRPADDHFNPPLKEIMYHQSGSFPLDPKDFKIYYIGKNPPPSVHHHVTTKEQWDYYKYRGICPLCAYDDELCFEVDDPGKILWFKREIFGHVIKSLMNECQLFRDI